MWLTNFKVNSLTQSWHLFWSNRPDSISEYSIEGAIEPKYIARKYLDVEWSGVPTTRPIFVHT